MPYPLVLLEPVISPGRAELLGFRCSIQSSNSDAWVRIVGELDLATAPRLQDVLRAAASRVRRIVVDLREVTFMDTSGVRVIVEASRRARQAGGRLVLVRGPSRVDRLFGLTGTAAELLIVDLDPFDRPVEALRRVARRASAGTVIGFEPRMARASAAAEEPTVGLVCDG